MHTCFGAPCFQVLRNVCVEFTSHENRHTNVCEIDGVRYCTSHKCGWGASQGAEAMGWPGGVVAGEELRVVRLWHGGAALQVDLQQVVHRLLQRVLCGGGGLLGVIWRHIVSGQFQ